jgi:hypothetical protein
MAMKTRRVHSEVSEHIRIAMGVGAHEDMNSSTLPTNGY